jgi:uncharacterized protein (DUF1330 family)
MSAYLVIVFRSIDDPRKVEAYKRLAGPLLEAAATRFIVRGEPARAYEAGVLERVVIIEFETLQKAIDTYESPAYRASLDALGDGAVRDVRIVEGV